jgi:hypothetical protein
MIAHTTLVTVFVSLISALAFAGGQSRTFMAGSDSPWVVKAVRAVSAPDLEPMIGQGTAVEMVGYLGGIETLSSLDDLEYQLVQESMGSRRLFLRFPDSDRAPLWLGWGHPLEDNQSLEHWQSLFQVRLRDGFSASAELEIYDKGVCMNDCLKAKRKLVVRARGETVFDEEIKRTCPSDLVPEDQPFMVRSLYCMRGGETQQVEQTYERRVLIGGESADLGAAEFQAPQTPGGSQWSGVAQFQGDGVRLVEATSRWLVKVRYRRRGRGHPWHSEVVIFDRSRPNPLPRKMRFYRQMVKAARIDPQGEKVALVAEYQGLNFRQSPPGGGARGQLLMVELAGPDLIKTIDLDFRDSIGEPANISNPQFQFSAIDSNVGYVVIGGAASRGCAACGNRQIAKVLLEQETIEPALQNAPESDHPFHVGGQAILVGGEYALVGRSGEFSHRVGSSDVVLFSLADGREVWRTNRLTFPGVDVNGSMGDVALSQNGREIWIADFRGERAGYPTDDGFLTVVSTQRPQGTVHRIQSVSNQWTLYGKNRVAFSPQTRELLALSDGEFLVNYSVPALTAASGEATTNRLSIFSWDYYRWARENSPRTNLREIRLIEGDDGPELMNVTETGPITFLRRPTTD